MEDEKENIYKQLLLEMQEIKEENKKLQNTIKQLRKTCGRITINTNNTNNTNNGQITYNNIKLVAYGKEDRDKLNQTDVINALQGYGTETKLTKLIHFNDKFPEYHNVYINNLKDKYVMVYNGNKWN